mmetsp:Transcript_3116/g.3605  ORF Transcript_3116/g.3605 Transcript_3116/m.3605 type:complete len:260 (-) Transcript_3116:131-910(-)
MKTIRTIIILTTALTHLSFKRSDAFMALPSTTTALLKKHSSSKTTSAQDKRHCSRRPLNLFGDLFEEAGPLGKGITVGKVQVALNSYDRSSTSISGSLEAIMRDSGGDDPEELSQLANHVCLALLRRSSDWIAASSESKWFKTDDAGKAESLFNDWSNREAAKFEKEYIPSSGTKEKGGGPTMVIVSLVVEIQGDETKFDGAGYSASGTRDVISSIAADCLVDDGYCLNAVEIFYTPSARDEVLTKNDMILDFPSLIDL